jgi:hypothetical protein
MSDEILYAELNGAVSARNTTGKPEIFGTVEIVSPSYYKFYKRFDATGKLKFVGPWDDPELEIDAVYEGSRTVYTAADTSGEGESRRIQVLLEITGRRYEPTLKITLREETSSSGHFVDIPTTGESEKEMQSNAVAFILTGKFSDDLTSSDKSSIAGAAPASTGEMVGSTLASSLLTGVLDEYLRREFPFIRSVDVSYEAGSSPGTRVEVSASALRGYLRIGGKILSDVGSASVSYRASLGELFDEPAVRNLFFQIEQRIEDTTSGSDNTVEGRVYYRFSF